jgi:hypothetical protein
MEAEGELVSRIPSDAPDPPETHRTLGNRKCGLIVTRAAKCCFMFAASIRMASASNSFP